MAQSRGAPVGAEPLPASSHALVADGRRLFPSRPGQSTPLRSSRSVADAQSFQSRVRTVHTSRPRRPRLLISVFVACQLVFFFTAVSGVQFEDEAGINDWRAEQVGAVTHLIGSGGANAEEDASFFVGTSHGILAAFKESEGTLRWRRVNRESDSVERLERRAPYLVAHIRQQDASPAGSPTAAFSAAPNRSGLYVHRQSDGSLLWSVEERVKAFALGTGHDDAPVVAIAKYGSSDIEVRSLEDGRVAWETGDRVERGKEGLAVPSATEGVDTILSLAHLSSRDHGSLLVLLYKNGPKSAETRARVLSFKDGKQLQDMLFQKAGSRALALVQGNSECAAFLALTPARDGPSTLQVLATSGPEAVSASEPFPLAAHVKPPGSGDSSHGVAALPVAGCVFAVAGGANGPTGILRGAKSRDRFQLREQHTLPAGPWAFGRLLIDNEQAGISVLTALGGQGKPASAKNVLLATTIESEAIQAFAMDMDTGTRVPYLSLPFEAQKREGEQLALAVAKQRSGAGLAASGLAPELVFGRLTSAKDPSGRRVVLAASDASLSLLTADKWIWSREESLADIRGTVMFTMPYTASRPAARREWASLPITSSLLPSGLERHTLEAALASSPSDPSAQRSWPEYLKLLSTRLAASAILGVIQVLETTAAIVHETARGIRHVMQRRPQGYAGTDERAGTKREAHAPFGFAALSAKAKLRLLGFVAFQGETEETADLALNPAEAEQADGARAGAEGKAPVVNVDPRLFGWTELIIAATCSDQIYAFHAATGLIIWRQSLRFWQNEEAQKMARRACRSSSALDASYFVGVSSTNGRKTSVLRVSPERPNPGGVPPSGGAVDAAEKTGIVAMHLVGEQKKELLAVFADPVAKSTRLVWLDAALGTVLHVAEVLFIPAHLVPLQAVSPYHQPVTGSPTERATQVFFEETNGVLLVDAGGKGSLLVPEKKTTETRLAWQMDCHLARHLSQHLSLYDLDVAGQQLLGFLVRTEETPGEQPGTARCVLMTHRTWNIPFGRSGQAIIASVRPLHSDYPHVPVLVTGALTIVYKYINPNLMAVVTKPEKPDTGAAAAGASLMLNVLNLTDGSVVYSEYLPAGASLPLHLMMYDNVVMAHYWNLQYSRYEMHIVELQDAQKDEGPLSIIFSAARHLVPTLTGFELPPPTAISQTYILPTGVRAFGVTATLQGITTRAILLATSASQQIYALSTRLANARRPRLVDDNGRPLKDAAPAQQQQQEEGVLPYHPLLPLLPQDCISYYNQVFHVRGIAAHHTSRESTSSTFAFGLDLFFSPVQPAKGYDELSSQFNYGLLAAAIVTLIGLVLVTHWRSKEADLAAKWK
ncbi:hypothetical protein BESB_056290 [Besnoitia besnoiti]|uniref:ER membrane protein complex subunit 1 n=1 Tax=Besnoitia besnoiti TaxID=94643 RepID=A0A2A9MBX6_BESBE|nr:hypothetical protein BESB_056290 [Besnoitia besnoiti]PFH35978.1 hypothetical protein BESB_056290 [Besnoitia besnoiti]